jgi:hypothetical protein
MEAAQPTERDPNQLELALLPVFKVGLRDSGGKAVTWVEGHTAKSVQRDVAAAYPDAKPVLVLVQSK